MLALFAGRKPLRIHVVSGEDEYWSFIRRYSGPQDIFVEQGDLHGEIDGNLAERVERLLIPLVGRWEESDRWFHNQDFYGDGIRSLMFREQDFPATCIPDLQALLCDGAATFCIHIQLCDKLYGEDIKPVGAIAIMHNDLVVTKLLAERMTFI